MLIRSIWIRESNLWIPDSIPQEFSFRAKANHQILDFYISESLEFGSFIVIFHFCEQQQRILDILENNLTIKKSLKAFGLRFQIKLDFGFHNSRIGIPMIKFYKIPFSGVFMVFPIFSFFFFGVFFCLLQCCREFTILLSCKRSCDIRCQNQNVKVNNQHANE